VVDGAGADVDAVARSITGGGSDNGGGEEGEVSLMIGLAGSACSSVLASASGSISSITACRVGRAAAAVALKGKAFKGSMAAALIATAVMGLQASARAPAP
jgi:hypothetical protein